jgi:DNA repair photolyase
MSAPHPTPQPSGYSREREPAADGPDGEDAGASPDPGWVPVAPPLKGRGTAWSVAHRFTSDHHEAYDDGWGTLDQQAAEEMLPPDTRVVEEHVKSIIAANDSPDISFDLSINPYRGCEHGCIYCFARPTHSYLNLSPGLDFETRIIAKVNAAERLREALMRPKHVPKVINLGSATDAYQPVERRLRITRSVIEVLTEFKHPFSVITKSSGIERDLDLIAPMAAQGLAMAFVSITTLDPALARILEPRAASPARRLKTIEALAKAGVPVGISVSPLIPFINEPELERVLEAGASAGATSGFSIVLRLPWEVNPLFQRWLDEHFPDRAARVMARVREMRGGKDYDAAFGQRMRGQGVWADLITQRLRKALVRYGLDGGRQVLDTTRFERPVRVANPAQGSLF